MRGLATSKVSNESGGQMSQVITIDENVRKLLDEFVNLYATFEQAATAINVNRSTIAVYMQGAHTVPAEQLREIIRIIKRRLSPEQITEIFSTGWEERMLASAHQHTFLHQDSTSYRLNEELIRLLEYFASYYPSRTRAAEALELATRTFTSFLKGGSQSLPRSIFDMVIELLRTEHNVSEQAVCEALAFGSFDSVLKPADRAGSSDMSANEVIESLVAFWQGGGGSIKSRKRPIYNFLIREHGNLATGYQALIRSYMAQYEERGQAAIADGRVDEVLNLLDLMLTACRWYTVQIRKLDSAGAVPEDMDWAEDSRKMIAIHNRLRDLLFKEAPFSHQYMAKTEVQKLLFRFRHLKGVREYLPSTNYRPGEMIFHPMFGVGRVTRYFGHHKVRVRFTDSENEIVLSIGT